MMKLHCRMRLGSVSQHLYQIIAGFELLARHGVIELVIERQAKGACAEPIPVNMLEVTLNREIRLLYDLNDGYDNLVEEPERLYGPLLRRYDICFKRSFSAVRNARLTHGEKICPLGLNYMVTIPGSVAHWPMPLDHPIEKMKKLIRMLPLTVHYYGWYTVEKFEDEPRPEEPPRVLFMARMWDVRGDSPDMHLPETKREERHYINEQRARTIRLCREAFGSLFHGGVAPTPFAAEHYPDLVIADRREVSRRAYLKRMKRSSICIATMGLHQSIGWKFAEYVAASKAIVTETLHYEVPGVFGENRNYLSFRTPEECVEAVARLIRDERLRMHLMQNNYNYYRRHVRPDRLVLNSLMAAVEPSRQETGVLVQ
ncbi:Putative uncharacterized protein [Thermobacillus xylanilyticus]|uniref:Spore protein YkvP/CgeB glycosyl transferase-like domain-containing protein n=2 Tax=Thermobacillus xylanilyticus TaxID=76633 RepID=A0ABM8V3Y0_THEXY|nr:Putative uncharacterized protein [Thermobacillus xylanilyticus]